MHFLHAAVLFLIVLGIMVLIHELGHFAVAKWCGVHVEAFSIGFGPRLFGFHIGDTDYRLSLLPLGGYVKMAGEVPGEESSGDPGEFNTHPRWQRALIGVAGPVANFILSFFIMLAIGMYHHEVGVFLDGGAAVDYVTLNSPAAQAGIAPGDVITSFGSKVNPSWQQVLTECQFHQGQSIPLTFVHAGVSRTGALPCAPNKDITSTNDPVIPAGLLPQLQPQPIGVRKVTADTPAQHAGLQTDDQIVRVDSLELHSVIALVSYLHDQGGAPMVLTVERDGKTVTLPPVSPEKMPTGTGDVDYRLGFYPNEIPTHTVRLPFPAAVKQSIKDNINDSTLVLRIVKGMFTRQVSVKSLSGPVGIAQQIDLAAQSGNWDVLRLMSAISLQLGILNLMPIPILDGGLILFLLIESIMRRDLNQQIKERVYQVAFVGLILFAAFVFFNDITKLRGH